MGLLSRDRTKVDFPSLRTDLHSHLLPGVDDGAKDPGESIELVRSLMDLGYEKIITTPHIYSELYPNSPTTLKPAFEKLKLALEEAAIGISLRFAAEYFLDDHLDSLLRQNEPLLTIHENWVLVETSFVQPHPDLDAKLFKLQVAGYKPILAHPERYAFWHGDKTIFHGFKEKGLLLQINLLSLTGYYGKGATEMAKYLLKADLVDLVGTDCHHERHVAALKKGAGELRKFLDPAIRSGRLLNFEIT